MNDERPIDSRKLNTLIKTAELNSSSDNSSIVKEPQWIARLTEINTVTFEQINEDPQQIHSVSVEHIKPREVDLEEVFSRKFKASNELIQINTGWISNPSINKLNFQNLVGKNSSSKEELTGQLKIYLNKNSQPLILNPRESITIRVDNPLQIHISGDDIYYRLTVYPK